MNTEYIQVLRERVERLIGTGKTKGFLTRKEIKEILGDIELDDLQMTKIEHALKEINIDVIEEHMVPFYHGIRRKNHVHRRTRSLKESID